MAKTYKAIFNRYNPQLGTYQTERTFEAANKREANKHCKKIEDGCIYGSMSLVSVEEV